MANITQHIPSYTGGISEQPDELKIPGQVNKAKNVLPDVVEGLLKRPGGKLVGQNLTVSSDPIGDNSPKGKSWFHYYRDENEQYIGQIHKFGDVKIWRCSDGQAMPVTNNLFKSRVGNAVKDSNGVWTITLTNWHLDHGVPAVGDLVYCLFSFYANSNQNLVVTEVVSNTEFKVQDTDTSTVSSTAINVYWSYLTHNNDSDLQFLTLNDYTYITNRQKTVAMSTDRSPVKPSEAFIQLKKVAYANQYAVNLFDTTDTTTETTATRINVTKTDDDETDICPHVDTKILNINAFTTSTGLIAFDGSFDSETWSTGDGVYSNVTHTIDNTTPQAPVLKQNALHKLTLNKDAAHNNDHSDDVQDTTNAINPGGNNANHNEDYFLRDSQTSSTIQQYTNHYKLKNLTTGQQLISAAVTGSTTTQVGIYADVVTALKAATAITDESLYKATGTWTSEGEYSSGDQIIHGNHVYTALIGTSNGISYAYFGAPTGTTLGGTEVGGVNFLWKCEGPKPITGHSGTYSNQEHEGNSSSYDQLPFTIEQAATDSPIINLQYKNADTPVGEWVLLRCNRPSQDLGYDSTHSNSYSDPGNWEEKGRERPYQAYVESTNGSYNGVKTTEVNAASTVTTTGYKKDLYFRVTTTGQSTPSTSGTGSNATTTYKCRYTTTYDLLFGGRDWIKDDNFTISLKEPSTGDTWTKSLYTVNIDEISTAKIQGNLGIIRPTPTSFDTKTTVTAESILGDLQAEIIAANPDWTAWPSSGETKDTVGVKIIGNGIYIRRTNSTAPFNITTPAGELLNVLSDEVKDVADLPEQCRHGYIVKVANSEDDEDDYYVKFIGQLQAKENPTDPDVYLDGKGTWQECIAPDQEYKYDPASMPIQIVRGDDGNFTVKQVTWEDALVGVTVEDGTGTNPRASFVGKTINNMLFFRNRLVMLSDENVIMSQPGDFFNFWAKSAITYGNTDMIDISCSSEFPAIVYDGIQVNSGLVLFTKNQQFMLTTDSDLLNPLTAKINSLSTYNFNFKTNPFSLGTTIGFLDNAGKYNRFWEMTAVLREGDPNVIEQSKTISKRFPNDIDMVANSRENQVVFFGKKGASTVYGFRYHTDAASRIQQAWFEWELRGTIQHIAILDDALYVILKNQENSVDKYHIEKYEIKADDPFVIDTDFNVHLDKSFKINSSDITDPLDQLRLSGTLTDIENFYNSDTDLVAYQINGNNFGQRYTATRDANNHIQLSDTPNGDIILGYEFETEVELPKIYLQQKAGDSFRSDIQSSLTLQRLKLNFGDLGTCTTTLNRKGKTTLTTTHEAKPITSSVAAAPFIESEETLTIPVYEKNKNVTITIKSKHPSPATLHSMNWEGDYTDKYYKRV
tara:strand:+ start:1887 stop:5969 length:4083 start_codon:yes stop_codon:yes gene_type:complete